MQTDSTNSADRLLLTSHEQSGPLDTPCLVWDRCTTTQDGYGQVRIKGKTYLVHRLAWIERHGPIPPETPHVLHRCDNPPCWADDHLWLGTQTDNMHDCLTKGRHRTNGNERRTHCLRGHQFDERNTSVDKRGWRSCRTCKNERQRFKREHLRRHD